MKYTTFIFLIFAMLFLATDTKQETESFATYIPLAYANPGIRGVQIWPGIATTHREQIIKAHSYWIKTHLGWNYIEIVQGVYNWPVAFDEDYAAIQEIGGKMIVVLQMAPEWARATDSVCGRIAPEHISDFAEFARQATLRYPKVAIFEIWNEEDTALSCPIPPYDQYGCWGDPEESYYGGAYYATVINPVRAAIKSANPDAQVYVGGLMMSEAVPESWGYFEGAVRAGAEFDGVSFHFYTWFSIGNKSPRAQVDTLRDVMKRYNIDRPIMLSETSMLYSGDGEPYETAQGEFVHFIYNETRRLGLQGFVWYTLPDSGWNHSGAYQKSRCKPACENLGSYDD